MMIIVLVSCLFLQGLNAESFQLWESSDPTTYDEYKLIMAQRLGLPGWMKIFPGTKWCGDGDIARDFEDLGEQSDTDMCCRAHDYCEHVIYGGETKYNLTNTAFHSKLICECDIAFRNCLKAVSTATSSSVGTIYFTLLNTQCFQEEHPIVECNKYSYFPWTKCINYQLDETQPKLNQWFDLPNY